MLTNQIASDPADHAADIPQVGLAIITGSANWGLAFPEDIEFDGVRTLRRDISFE
ncbi:MAG: 5'-methylthioadenosine phosphorylase, partial [Mesorhizobium sp.]